MRLRQIILSFFSSGIFAFIGQDHFDNLQDALTAYFRNYPQEKIYLQTDQCTYLTGQTIWFQLYEVAYGKPSALSRIAYVQLIDTAGHFVSLNKLSLSEGVAQGNMLLPDSLPTGSYQLRAFSAWMLNFGEDGISRKQIAIKMATDTAHLTTSKNVRRKVFQLQFFPEGGDLVVNTACNLAFKATDQDGIPADVFGEIEDSQDSVIGRFQSIHDGMGKFMLRPAPNRSYTASVHFPDGTTRLINLPAAKPFGIALKVLVQTEKAISVEITNTEKEKGALQTVWLAAFQNSGRLAVYPLELESRNNIFNIPVSNYSTGILRLTVMDNDNIPLAERIAFIDKNDALEGQLHADAISFDPKTKSTFSVQLKRFYPGVDSIRLAIAVTDADRSEDDTLADNIVSAVLISSELKGSIYRPAQYFPNRTEQSREALDLVMLTNGWRHFTWKKVLDQQTMSLKYAVEKSLSIAGHIVDFKTSFEMTTNSLSLLIRNQDNSRYFGHILPDSNGDFILNDYDIMGNSSVSYQQSNIEKNIKPMRISFFVPFIDTMQRAPFLAREIDILKNTNFLQSINPINEDNPLLDRRKGMLPSVTVKGKIPSKIEQLRKNYVSPYFEGGYFHDVDLVNNFYPNSTRFFDFLKGRFPGLWVTGTEYVPEFYLRSSTATELIAAKSTNDGRPPTTFKPYLYVNEISTTWEDVVNIPLSDIALIRYIPPPASMAPMNGGFLGVLAIYIKKEGEISGLPQKKEEIPTYAFHGYSITREFYNPDYSRKDSSLSVPDYRTTLYWNTNLKPDHSGNIHFSFYNSDRAKKFRMVMEGMDNRGRPVYLHSVIAAR